MTGVVALLLISSIVATWQSYVYDINYPYSGSQAAAEFIKAHHIDRARLFGAGFPTLGIQPYFRHNIFANYRTPTNFAFWFWSTRAPWFYRPARVLHVADLQAWMAAQIAQRPDFFLISMKFPQDGLYADDLLDAGYKEIAVFPGALFWKQEIIERESFRLFARPDLVRTAASSPAPAGEPSRTETPPR